MTTFPKGKTVDTTNLQSVELIHVYLVFYNMTSVLGFTSMLNILCENTIIIWLFTTASKVYPVRVIFCILTTFNNEQHPCKGMRVGYYGALENSTDVCVCVLCTPVSVPFHNY